jgi:hypothetical protein
VCLRAHPFSFWAILERVRPDLEQYKYPPYDQPLLSAYDGRFEAAYVILHPFQKETDLAARRPRTGGRTDLSGCEKYRWTQVAAETGLRNYSEIDHGLRSAYARKEFWNPTAAAALREFQDGPVGAAIWRPDEGEFPSLLENDFAFIFERGQSLSLWAVPHVLIPSMPAIGLPNEICSNDLHRVFPRGGSLVAYDQSFLFTVDWDSAFTLFYGTKDFLIDVTRSRTSKASS